MSRFLKILFHALPLIGAMNQRWYLTFALFLLVVLPYVKLKKLQLELETVKDEERKKLIKISITRFEKIVYKIN